MGRLSTFVLGAVVGAGLVLGAQKFHIVRASDGFYAVPKLNSSFSEVYVDVRHFGIKDWAEHASLAAAIIKAKKDHLLKGSVVEELGDGFRGALDSITDGE